MKEVEKRRLEVTAEEIEHTRGRLAEAKIPGPRNPTAADQNSSAGFTCMRCDNHWSGIYNAETERTCPACRSNSVRWIRTLETSRSTPEK
jgi:hypothetical protein